MGFLHLTKWTFLRQYDKIHEKREEVVRVIEETNREAKHFKEKMQKLREKCNQRTQKAQVSFNLTIYSFDSV